MANYYRNTWYVFQMPTQQTSYNYLYIQQTNNIPDIYDIVTFVGHSHSYCECRETLSSPCLQLGRPQNMRGILFMCQAASRQFHTYSLHQTCASIFGKSVHCIVYVSRLSDKKEAREEDANLHLKTSMLHLFDRFKDFVSSRVFGRWHFVWLTLFCQQYQFTLPYFVLNISGF